MQRTSQGRTVSLQILNHARSAFIPNALPPEPPVRVSTDLAAQFDEAMLSLGHFSGVLATLEDRDTIAAHMARVEAQLSCALDGITVELGDLYLLELGCTLCGEMPQAELVQCYEESLSAAFERLSDRAALLESILQLHGGLFTPEQRPLDAARWRTGFSLSDEAEALGEGGALLPPPAAEVPRLMNEWEGFVHSTCGSFSTIPTVGLAHLQFDVIQPFSVGSGRMCRAVTSLLLGERGMKSARSLPLSYYLYQHREAYRQVLKNVPVQGDWELCLSFIAKALAAGAQHGARVATALQQKLKDDQLAVGKNGRQATSMLAVLSAFAKHPITTGTELSALTGLMPMTVNKALSSLIREGIVKELTGQRRWRIYSYTGLIDILVEGTGITSCY